MTERPQDRSGEIVSPARPGQRPHAPGDLVEVSLVALVNVLLRRRRIVLGVPAALVVVATALAVLIGAGEYTARSRFMPQDPGSGDARLTGMAAQFAIMLGKSSGAEPLGFYAALLESREILRSAVTTTYRYENPVLPGDTIVHSLVDLFGPEDAPPEARVATAVDGLADRLSIGIEAQSGLLVLETMAPARGLAVAINQRLLELVNEFNLDKRQSRARAEREFAGARMREAERELLEAEAELEGFLERNRRGFDTSPQLAFEKARLERRIALRQELFSSLAEAFEQARLMEVRNTPVITVIDPPGGHVRGAGPNLTLSIVIALFLGGTLGIAMAFATEHMDRQRKTRPDVYGEFDALRRQVAAGLLPHRWLTSLRRVRARAPEPDEAERQDVVERV